MLKSPETEPRQLDRGMNSLFGLLLCTGIVAGALANSAVAQVVQDASLASSSAADEDSVPGRVVVDVRIEGNETIPESVILQKVQSQPHRAVTEKLLREDKRSLLNTRWFFEVRERIDETPDGLVLVFVVKERPIVQRVVFRGNKKVKLKYLEAWTGLKAGSPFDYVANQEAVRRIEQEYRDKGYYFVKVQLTSGSKPGDREVVFDIQEGPKVQVKERNFEGNQFWSDGMLRKNLISKEAFLLWGGHYNPDTIPSDVEASRRTIAALVISMWKLPPSLDFRTIAPMSSCCIQSTKAGVIRSAVFCLKATASFRRRGCRKTRNSGLATNSVPSP